MADNSKLTRRVYNLTGMSFTPAELAASIKKCVPDFEIEYAPDYRAAIAETWPRSIDDSESKKDWGWEHNYSLD